MHLYLYTHIRIRCARISIILELSGKSFCSFPENLKVVHATDLIKPYSYLNGLRRRVRDENTEFMSIFNSKNNDSLLHIILRDNKIKLYFMT